MFKIINLQQNKIKMKKKTKKKVNQIGMEIFQKCRNKLKENKTFKAN